MAKQNPFTLVAGIGTANAAIYGANANLVCSGNIVIQGNAAATSNTTGALQIAGSLYVAGNLYVQGSILGNGTLTQLGNIVGSTANVQVNDFFMGVCASTVYNAIGTVYVNPTINVSNGSGTAYSASRPVPAGSYRLAGVRDSATSSVSCPSLWVRTA